jgi:hypothetical protein
LLEDGEMPDTGDSFRRTRKKQRTVTRTFRITAEWDNVLKQEAAKQGTSINVLVNSIFQKYALFDRWAQDYNSINISQKTFQNLISQIQDEKMASVGEKSGSQELQNVLDLIGLQSTYQSFTYLLSTHFGGAKRAMWFTCCHHSQENIDFFHLQHNLGRGWSAFLQEYFLSHLKKMKIKAETRVYDYALNLKVQRPPQFGQPK